MHHKNIKYAGVELTKAKKALIMIHGRGASADDILSVADYLNVDEFALIAPEATHHTWYPYSFLVPQQQNEPWLSSALKIVSELVHDLIVNKINYENIYFLGFSQGACLTSEYICRNARKYGGAAIFTGGLIGDEINRENYKGDFEKTPLFIGSSDPDMHVPVSRVEETRKIMTNLNADVQMKLYKNMGHTISNEEISFVNDFIFKK